MYVGITTLKSAERNGGPKAYLARLTPAGREWAPRGPKPNNSRRSYVFRDARPGQVFEARRWWWNGDDYAGGTVWFTLGGDGTIHQLTRVEAMAAAANRLLDAPPVTANVPAVPTAERYDRLACCYSGSDDALARMEAKKKICSPRPNEKRLIAALSIASS